MAEAATLSPAGRRRTDRVAERANADWAPVREIALANETAALDQLTRWIDGLGRDLAAAETVVFDLKLCAYEAVANIISYAYDDDGHHLIKVYADVAPGAVALTVEDDGRPFNPLERPSQRPADRLEDASIGGHGIRLMREIADAVTYRRVDGRNRLTIEKRFG